MDTQAEPPDEGFAVVEGDPPPETGMPAVLVLQRGNDALHHHGSRWRGPEQEPAYFRIGVQADQEVGVASSDLSKREPPGGPLPRPGLRGDHSRRVTAVLLRGNGKTIPGDGSGVEAMVVGAPDGVCPGSGWPARGC